MDLWINRETNNFKELYITSQNDADFFKKISLLNTKIRYIFPWVWSLIIKLLISFEPHLEDILKYIPYYIKFGANSVDKLIEFIYDSNKELKIDNKSITKEVIRANLD